MLNKLPYFLSAWLLCAHGAYAAEATDSALQQQLGVLSLAAQPDWPYPKDKMEWRDFYRDGNKVVMVYQDGFASSTRANRDRDMAQLRQDMAPALCPPEDQHRDLPAGFELVTQIQFKNSAPLRLSHALADCEKMEL